MLRVVMVLGLSASTTCAIAPASTQSTPPDGTEGEVTGDADDEPTLEPQGPPLEATVPLLGGSSVDLAELRGRVVLLELSATDRPHWADSQRQYQRLVEVLGSEQLVVVSVAADPDATDLREHWDRGKPPFVLGWDPQGALALRLGVAALPTVFILDRRGRPLATVSSDDPAFARRIEDIVRAAVDN